MRHPFHLETIRPAHAGTGLLGGLSYRDGRFFAAGGTSAPLLLTTTTGTLRRLRLRHRDGLRGSHIAANGDLWVVGTRGLVARSTDAGATWTHLATGVAACFFRIIADDAGALWVCGDGGHVLTSSDDGASWTRLKAGGQRLFGLALVDGTVMVYGRTLFTLKRGRFKALDLESTAPLTSLAQTPSGDLLIVGDDGQAYRSTDTFTWRPVRVGARDRDIEQVVTLAHGMLLMGQRGMARYSEDDGHTWVQVRAGTRNTLWGAVATPDGALIGAEDGQVIRLTYDGAIDPFSGE
jgi:photosystem II stability/assembly factor-like uncharacterized protein